MTSMRASSVQEKGRLGPTKTAWRDEQSKCSPTRHSTRAAHSKQSNDRSIKCTSPTRFCKDTIFPDVVLAAFGLVQRLQLHLLDHMDPVTRLQAVLGKHPQDIEHRVRESAHVQDRDVVVSLRGPV